MVSTPLPEFSDQLALPGLPSPAHSLMPWHGRRVNHSALAREFEVSHQTAARRLAALERCGFLRLLHPLPAAEQRGKRSAPVLRLRDPRLLEGLPVESLYGTRLVEAIVSLAGASAPASRIGYLPRPHGGMVEPVVELAAGGCPALVGFAFCPDLVMRRGRWSTLTRAQRMGLLRQGFVLYPGRRAFFSSARVAVVPDRFFLEHYAGWMAAALDPSPRGLQALMRRCNTPGAGPAPGAGPTPGAG